MAPAALRAAAIVAGRVASSGSSWRRLVAAAASIRFMALLPAATWQWMNDTRNAHFLDGFWVTRRGTEQKPVFV